MQEVFGNATKVKLLVYLAKSNEINVTALAKASKINHTTVKKSLEELNKLGIIQEKRFGRIRIFSINESNDAGKRIKEFIKKWDRGYNICTST